MSSQNQSRQTYLYKDLSAPLTLMGVEYRLFMLNVMVTFFFVLSAKLYWWIALTVAIHFVLVGVTRADPAMRKIYISYSRFGNRYEPWPLPRLQRRRRRPDGFGTNAHC